MRRTRSKRQAPERTTTGFPPTGPASPGGAEQHAVRGCSAAGALLPWLALCKAHSRRHSRHRHITGADGWLGIRAICTGWLQRHGRGTRQDQGKELEQGSSQESQSDSLLVGGSGAS